MAPIFGKFTLACLVLYHSMTAWAQISEPFTSAYSAGLLSSDRFTKNRDVFILQPSILPSFESPFISAQIQSRFAGFDIFALGLHMATALPMNFGMGLSVLNLGNEDFKSSEITISAGKQLGPALAIGTSQQFQRSQIAHENRPWNGTTSISGTYNHGQWGLGMLMTGLMPWGWHDKINRFSIQLSGYMICAIRTQLYGLLNYSDHNLLPVTGIRQTLIKNVELFGAFQWYPARYALGFLIPLSDQLESIVSTQYLPVLGWSPAIGLQWKMRKREE